jgi:hypothetical protein
MRLVILHHSTSGSQQFGTWGVVLTIAVVTALAVVLILGAARLRKNWLRRSFSALLIVGVAAEFWLIPHTAIGSNKVVQALTVCADILDVTWVFLLFFAGADAWFRRPVAAIA